MPGSIVFKPIEAHLTHDTELITKMDPYCAFMVGNQAFNSEVSKKGGKHPQWSDAITVPVANESTINVNLMDKDHVSKDDIIGSFTVDLQEIESKRRTSKWYPIFHKEKPAGEILVVASFQGAGSIIGEQVKLGHKDERFLSTQNEFIHKEQTIVTSQQPKRVIEERTEIIHPEIRKEEVIVSEKIAPIVEEGSRFYTEQRQTMEPHTFLKEIDVVEIRPTAKEIMVTEPRKVLQEVQYTEVVPVMKTIETTEARVVKKEIEVLEPIVVEKTIQVLEDVPIMKKIEVVENRTVLKEVETFEPQTFTKEVEVIVQVPVKKTVTITEPVNVKKMVECVEEVVTTETVTKKVQPAVVINEEVTKTVGHAEIVGVRSDIITKEKVYVDTHAHVDQIKETKIVGQEKLIGSNLESKLVESEYVNKKL